jgi:hypothetical protein
MLLIKHQPPKMMHQILMWSLISHQQPLPDSLKPPHRSQLIPFLTPTTSLHRRQL